MSNQELFNKMSEIYSPEKMIEFAEMLVNMYYILLKEETTSEEYALDLQYDHYWWSERIEILKSATA